MKKLLATTAIAAALIVGAQSAQAAPIMTLTLSNSTATAAQCTHGAGVGSAVLDPDTQSVGTWDAVTSTCTITGMDGAVQFNGTFGSFFSTAEGGSGNGLDPLSKSQPALWFNSNESANSSGVLTMTLSVNNYGTPTGTFPLISTASGSVDTNMAVILKDFYDTGNTGVAGAGGLPLLTGNWAGPITSGSVPDTIVSETNPPGSLYSESWTETVTSTVTNGLTRTTGINGTLDTTPVPSSVPTPTPLSLLGFGLLALAFVSRRRGFES